jgi:hypothetical protein
VLDSLAFDLLPHVQNFVCTPEVDVGRLQIVQALAVTGVVVVFDEAVHGVLEIAGQVVVLEVWAPRRLPRPSHHPLAGQVQAQPSDQWRNATRSELQSLRWSRRRSRRRWPTGRASGLRKCDPSGSKIVGAS